MCAIESWKLIHVIFTCFKKVFSLILERWNVFFTDCLIWYAALNSIAEKWVFSFRVDTKKNVKRLMGFTEVREFFLHDLVFKVWIFPRIRYYNISIVWYFELARYDIHGGLILNELCYTTSYTSCNYEKIQSIW